MKMVLMSGAGVSSLFPITDTEAVKYWAHRIIEKGDFPTVEILDMGEAA